MQKKQFLFTTLIICLLLISCKKNGEFITDKTTYKQGEIITVSNTTEKSSKFYKWDFGGVEIIEINPTYTLPENTPVGSFTISILPVNSLNTTDNWKKGSKTVDIVEAEEAKFLFYLSAPILSASDEICVITIGDVSKEVAVHELAPNCESKNNLNAVTFDHLKPGTYDYLIHGSSSSGEYTLTGKSTLTYGYDCQIIDIFKL
ncbi:hypothetical protein DNU06_14890 [Putridiphycobacter roseus]|uniref:PKD domain-containing protein n=1 Tax=Putridiphycobacter roseus TaxID=2219161 RepID=A0A2W1MZN9_9FLAO|nr:hypothetical protein [Putridiphycobacter roseus]PZE16081.1 hypothetical protein DNU06_14890 [Putridiphycobacter roseus]